PVVFCQLLTTAMAAVLAAVERRPTRQVVTLWAGMDGSQPGSPRSVEVHRAGEMVVDPSLQLFADTATGNLGHGRYVMRSRSTDLSVCPRVTVLIPGRPIGHATGTIVWSSTRLRLCRAVDVSRIIGSPRVRLPIPRLPRLPQAWHLVLDRAALRVIGVRMSS